MVVILDTNHFRELVEAGVLGRRLLARIEENQAEVFTCIVAAEETLRGWMALLNQQKPGPDQIAAYVEFQRSLETLAYFTIMPFDHETADHFVRLRSQFPRHGTMDLKIAAICLAHDTLLLSRNLQDFEKIPGLKVENWLD